MKHIKMIALFMLFVASSANAQNANHHKRLTLSNYQAAAKMNAEGMKESLRLNDEQAKEIAVIEEKFYKGVLSSSEQSLSIVVRKEQLEKAQREKEESLKKVLTAEQWKQYQDHMVLQKKKAKEQMEERKKKWVEQKG